MPRALMTSTLPTLRKLVSATSAKSVKNGVTAAMVKCNGSLPNSFSDLKQHQTTLNQQCRVFSTNGQKNLFDAKNPSKTEIQLKFGHVKTVDDLIEGYKRFRTRKYKKHKELYRELGQGQSPKVMLIGCADSRCEPSDIFDAAPGQLFVVRNVANLVPPYQPSGKTLHGVSAALEFAVTALKVENIVVMGHGRCGGVAASLSAAQNEPVGEFIAPWVKLLDAPRDKVLKEAAEKNIDPQYALELAGIEQSIANLQSFPFVQKAIDDGQLKLYGAWFAIEHGELHWRDCESKEFSPIKEE